MTWVSSHRTPAGYVVAMERRGHLIGFVSFERETGWWHFYCGLARCKGHAVDGSKAAAAEQAREHYLIEHR